MQALNALCVWHCSLDGNFDSLPENLFSLFDVIVHWNGWEKSALVILFVIFIENATVKTVIVNNTHTLR